MYMYFPQYLYQLQKEDKGQKPLIKCVISSLDLQENIVNFISFITPENFEMQQSCL